MERVDLMTETCMPGIWIHIAPKTSSLSMNRTLERMVIVGMVMKDVLTLNDVKQTWTVRLQAPMICLRGAG
jgi:hypothetical protein